MERKIGSEKPKLWNCFTLENLLIYAMKKLEDGKLINPSPLNLLHLKQKWQSWAFSIYINNSLDEIIARFGLSLSMTITKFFSQHAN
jgi:hypothetical protein